MPSFTNIAAYQFTPLTALKEWREQLLEQCRAGELKGTILLSTEGINLFMAGERGEIERLLATLRAKPGLESLQAKFSESTYQPFTRLLIRIKKEIIAFGVEGIDPARHTAPKLSPRELKQWLDEGRPVTLLDTRNDYEVKLGTFRHARTLELDHFRNFPQAVRRLPEALKQQPIVMFCTGGIRCEKAGPFMEREGFQHVHQLDGGILKYFEECGSAHFEGECFVFDHRVGLDPALGETHSVVCFNCQTPLTQEEQRSPQYVPEKSCPNCWRAPEEAMVEAIARRHETLRRVATPLPGSVPYDHYRPLKVPAHSDGLTVREMLAATFAHRPAEVWVPVVEGGRLRNSAGAAVTMETRVKCNERLVQLASGMLEPDVNANIRILFEDEALIVVNKPAPLPMHVGGRYTRNTLAYLLAAAYSPQKPLAAHRLDANTTGVIVVCRTRRFAALVQPQFSRGEVEKRYLVKVHGHPPQDEFICDAAISSQPGSQGSREIEEHTGLASLTEFSVLARHADGTALLEARPRTGRTNQIRLHLQHLGWPVCGDPLYGLRPATDAPPTLGVNDPPLCLHAWKITLRHPLRNERMEFTAEPPAWASE